LAALARALFVAELARLWGISCMPHCWAGGLVIAASTHLLALLPDTSWARTTETPMLELDRVENPFREELFSKTIEIRRRLATVPDKPGLGVEIDEEKLAFYAKG
jgi:D-galactarolactone cycloisomerase